MSTQNAKTVLTFKDCHHGFGFMLSLGILFIILGAIGLSMVSGLTLASMFFLGVILLAASFSQIFNVFKSSHLKAAIPHTLVAVLYFIGGILIIYDPFLASSVITAAIAGVFIIIGIIRISLSIMLNGNSGWGWTFFSGITAIILGVLILTQWPFSGVWFIGLFISIELIISGWTYVFLAFAIKKAN